MALAGVVQVGGTGCRGHLWDTPYLIPHLGNFQKTSCIQSGIRLQSVKIGRQLKSV
jgi:hypothetical protein